MRLSSVRQYHSCICWYCLTWADGITQTHKENCWCRLGRNGDCPVSGRIPDNCCPCLGLECTFRILFDIIECLPATWQHSNMPLCSHMIFKFVACLLFDPKTRFLNQQIKLEHISKNIIECMPATWQHSNG